MRHAIIRNFICSCAAVLALNGCAVFSLAKTSRYAFSPPLSDIVRSNAARAAGEPLAERYAFAWQRVEQELEPTMRINQEKKIVVVSEVPRIDNLVAQARERAEDASARRKLNAKLARTAETRGDARYHLEMASLNADQALLNEQLAVSAGRTDAAVGAMSATFGLYNSLAKTGKKLNDTDFGNISRGVVEDLNFVGAGAPPGSRLYIEYHYGLEPAAGKQFNAGLAVMFGGDTEANNAAMVTAVLTLPNGRRVSATRLVKIVWFAGEGNVTRAFPPGYEEYPLADLPRPPGFDTQTLDFAVLNVLARATLCDIRDHLKAEQASLRSETQREFLRKRGERK